MLLRETTKEDIEFVAKHSISRGIFSKQPQAIDFCYTLEHEGKVLGVGGMRLINSTTAWCWLDATEYAKDHWKTAYRVIKEWINELVELHGIKRLQAYIEPDFPEAIRMARHLGFHWESTMPCFVGDKSAKMYVRFIGIE